jgi:hypothetical protein
MPYWERVVAVSWMFMSVRVARRGPFNVMAGMIPAIATGRQGVPSKAVCPTEGRGMTGGTALLNYRTVLVFTSTASGFRHVLPDAQSCALRCR